LRNLSTSHVIMTSTWCVVCRASSRARQQRLPSQWYCRPYLSKLFQF